MFCFPLLLWNKQKNYCKCSCLDLLLIHYFLFLDRIESIFEYPRRNGKPKPVSSFLISAPWKIITPKLFAQHLGSDKSKNQENRLKFPQLPWIHFIPLRNEVFSVWSPEDKPSAALCSSERQRWWPTAPLCVTTVASESGEQTSWAMLHFSLSLVMGKCAFVFRIAMCAFLIM